MATHLWSEIDFEQLFENHGSIIYNFLIYRGLPGIEAEDMVQEVFVRFWKNRSKVLPEKALAFLFQIARNLLIDYKRHQKVEINFQLQFKDEISVTTPLEVLMQSDFKEAYLKALNTMPAHFKIVFLLNRLDGLTYKEIALALELSEKAIEKRMSNALKHLRLFLEQRGF